MLSRPVSRRSHSSHLHSSHTPLRHAQAFRQILCHALLVLYFFTSTCVRGAASQRLCCEASFFFCYLAVYSRCFVACFFFFSFALAALRDCDSLLLQSGEPVPGVGGKKTFRPRCAAHTHTHATCVSLCSRLLSRIACHPPAPK
jgi:hypothetical protein